MFTLPVIDYEKPENPIIANTVGITDEEVYATQEIMQNLQQASCDSSGVVARM
jgi:hypothetical protein